MDIEKALQGTRHSPKHAARASERRESRPLITPPALRRATPCARARRESRGVLPPSALLHPARRRHCSERTRAGQRAERAVPLPSHARSMIGPPRPSNARATPLSRNRVLSHAHRVDNKNGRTRFRPSARAMLGATTSARVQRAGRAVRAAPPPSQNPRAARPPALRLRPQEGYSR
jgi:hypothetical protein